MGKVKWAATRVDESRSDIGKKQASAWDCENEIRYELRREAGRWNCPLGSER